MYTLTEISVTRPLLISYIAEKAGTSNKKVYDFLQKETMFKEAFEDMVKVKTATLQDLKELSEWYIVFSSDPFYG